MMLHLIFRFGKITKIDEIKDDENYIELTITGKRIAKVGEPPKLFDFGPGPVVRHGNNCWCC